MFLALGIRNGDLSFLHVNMAVKTAVVRATPKTNSDPAVILAGHLDRTLPRLRIDRPILVQRCPSYMSVTDLGRFVLGKEEGLVRT